MREGVELLGSGTKLRRRYRIRLVEMNGKERTPFEETSVTIYEQDRGYTFFWF